MAKEGAPLLVIGQYAFAEPRPWRSLEYLAHGIDLPVSLTRHGNNVTLD